MNDIGEIHISTIWKYKLMNKSNMMRDLKQIFKFTKKKILEDMFELKIRNIKFKWNNKKFNILCDDDANEIISGTYDIYATTLHKSPVIKIVYQLSFINSHKIIIRRKYSNKIEEVFSNNFEIII